MASVIDDLARWGPTAPPIDPISLEEAEAYCRQLTRSHYENFPVASLLLPRTLRQHFANVYAYCRWADDLGDETGDRQRSLELLAWWREGLDGCFQRVTDRDVGRIGNPSYERGGVHPVFVALERTIAEFGIPREPFADLISAFEQDQHVRRHETFEQLLDYCRRSANPVGRIVLHLCRNVSDQTLAWSDSICTGLQLANFWQDVARDFEVGRVYLPAEDRRRFGYSDGDLEGRRTNEAFLQLMRFEVDRARDFLTAGLPLVGTMRGRMQVDIEMFIRGGLRILEEVETIGFRVWDQRPVVGKLQVASMFAACAARAVARGCSGLGGSSCQAEL